MLTDDAQTGTDITANDIGTVEATVVRRPWVAPACVALGLEDITLVSATGEADNDFNS